MTMILSFSSSVGSPVDIDVLSTVTGYFESRKKKIMSSGLQNYRSVYCLSFSLNFLYWSLASLWSVVNPKTKPKLSNPPLKFRINDVYSGYFKQPPRPPHTWLPKLPPQPPRPHPQTSLLELALPMVLWLRLVVVSPSLPLLTVSGGDTSVFEAVNYFF